MTQLNITDLYFAYDSDKPLFHNFSLSLKKNQLKTIVGESGSGKSTIFGLLTGRLKPQSGDIEVPRLSIVYQDPYSSFHPNYTILDQISDVVDSLDGLEHIIARLNIEKNLLHKKPKSLSGGELQRCSILRAVLMRPDVLLLDEPTSALDNIVAYDVMTMLVEFLDDFAILLITHDMDLATWCGGEIISIGKKD